MAKRRRSLPVQRLMLPEHSPPPPSNNEPPHQKHRQHKQDDKTKRENRKHPGRHQSQTGGNVLEYPRSRTRAGGPLIRIRRLPRWGLTMLNDLPLDHMTPA